MSGNTITCEIAVLGAGPGGYSAAFRAADLGLDSVLIERNARRRLLPAAELHSHFQRLILTRSALTKTWWSAG